MVLLVVGTVQTRAKDPPWLGLCPSPRTPCMEAAFSCRSGPVRCRGPEQPFCAHRVRREGLLPCLGGSMWGHPEAVVKLEVITSFFSLGLWPQGGEGWV